MKTQLSVKLLYLDCGVGTSASKYICWKTMFVNFNWSLMKHVIWTMRREIVKSLACQPIPVDSAAVCNLSEENSVPTECLSTETKC